jgi:hypothetical protein
LPALLWKMKGRRDPATPIKPPIHTPITLNAAADRGMKVNLDAVNCIRLWP